MIKRLSLWWIRRYQRRGGARAAFNTECNFIPSCSEYTYQSISQYGVCKGWRLGFARIRRCNQPDLVEKIHDEVP